MRRGERGHDVSAYGWVVLATADETDEEPLERLAQDLGGRLEQPTASRVVIAFDAGGPNDDG